MAGAGGDIIGEAYRANPRLTLLDCAACMSFSPLQRRLRKVSRIALYGTLALLVALGAFLVYLAADPLVRERRVSWSGVDYASMESVRLLQDYVRIDTSAPTGSSLAGARFLAGVLDRAGIPYHLERIGETSANLWAVLEGKNREAVVLHNHIDTDPAPHPKSWPYPPFDARIVLPWMYGRGSFDMKSIGIAQLLAFIDLAKSGKTPTKSVIFLATTGEETGSALGTRWILRQHPELADRFGVVLTEGGVVEGRAGDDLKYWGTEFAQKRFLTLVACDPSRERLEHLKDDVGAYGAEEPDLNLVDEVRQFLPVYARSRDRADLREVYAHPERIVRDRPLFETLPSYVQAMFRDELHPQEVRRVEGGEWELPVGIHLLPGVELDDVRDELIPDWLFYGVRTTIYPSAAAHHGSPIDHRVMGAIRQLVRQTHPEVPVGPVFLSWVATDSRFFRAHGIPSYGFSPFLILTSDAVRVAGVGERIALPAYVDGVALYDRLLHRLAD